MSDSGERELVLGNKQLLAIFFAATLLCGVFFAVGYVVGGNSAKSLTASAATDAASSTAGSEGKREEPLQPGADNSVAAAPAPTDTGGSVPAAEPRMADNPVAAGSKPEATSVAAAPIPAVPFQSPAQVKTASTAQPAAAPGIFVSIPEKGASYVQVTAAARPNAEVLVKTFRDARLPAILTASSKPDLYRVMVGPYRSPLPLAEAKRKLTDLGFGNLIVSKQ